MALLKLDACASDAIASSAFAQRMQSGHRNCDSIAVGA
jgi:hypothetical protein